MLIISSWLKYTKIVIMEGLPDIAMFKYKAEFISMRMLFYCKITWVTLVNLKITYISGI